MNILKYIKRWFQKSLESKKSYPDIQREKDFLHSGKSFFQQYFIFHIWYNRTTIKNTQRKESP